MESPGGSSLLRAPGLALGALLLAACATPGDRPVADAGTFFDDFSQSDLASLARTGWTIRSQPGHPGIPGATWGGEGVSLVDDPALPGNRLLRLRASTRGTSASTVQAQVCHRRKFLGGTYAARVRFVDAPVAGGRGDLVVQTFYAVSPLRFDFDPEYSEIDWEYLPNGGWGEPRPRLYGVSWNTVRIEPWLAFNAAWQGYGSWDGWHELVTQVGEGKVRLFVDGVERAAHGGRNVPVAPMAPAFSVWFSPSGLMPESPAERAYVEEIDWVYHARNRILSPREVDEAVGVARGLGLARIDTVPEADPPLASDCNL